jgi:HAD superfamily hydrolase (TIGR01509 family)
MDGVLVDSMAHHHTSWRKTFLDKGAKIPEEEFRRDVYLREGERAETTIKDFAVKYPLPSADSHEEILKYKRAHFQTLIPFMAANQGMPELLNFLKSSGIKLALVSGSARMAVEKIVKNHFDGLFDCVLTGSDVTKGKPDPLPYTTAAAKLGIDIRDCLIIENAPLGVRAGVAAGARVVGILLNSPLTDEVLVEAGACRVYKSVGALRDYLEKELLPTT